MSVGDSIKASLAMKWLLVNFTLLTSVFALSSLSSLPALGQKSCEVVQGQSSTDRSPSQALNQIETLKCNGRMVVEVTPQVQEKLQLSIY